VILTPLPAHRLHVAIASLAGRLEDARAARALRWLGSRPARRARGAAAESHRRTALALARKFAMGVRRGVGKTAFGWDGRALQGRTEAYVLLHEIAHYQIVPPTRRRAPDFGLGPGPDSNDHAGAERRARLFGAARDREEALASLLGILWEAELGQPALASLLDQNWLEGADRPEAARHFTAAFAQLLARRHVGATGRPRRRFGRAAKDAA
jgi:hypothetical protein